MKRTEAEIHMNELGRQLQPFLFIISFDMNDIIILEEDRINPDQLLFYINGRQNHLEFPESQKQINLEKFPVNLEKYAKAFVDVQKEIRHGNSYLLNLTFPTRIKAEASLLDIYHQSRAKYRLWYKDQFVVFSPEIFVQIRNNSIFSFPMKGTIDASLPSAAKMILEDSKEMAEHNTIVDLIRNDLGMVAKNVRLVRFRYIDRIKTSNKDLLQVSSEIRGDMKKGWENQIGSILFRILPAGSVSGAPKRKTVEIINTVEKIC